MLHEASLSSEERVRRAVRAAKADLVPAYIDVLKRISPAVKLANANRLFIMARDALYYQELRRGRSPEEARRIAAQRLLNSHDW